MEIATKKFASFLLGLALIIFLSIAFLGISQTVMGMEKRADGTMSGCMFSGKAEICTMTFSEHIARWQAVFTTTVPQNAFAFTLVLLAVFAVFFIKKLWDNQELELVSLHKQRFRDQIFSAHSPLQEAFSSGILHPKIF